MRILGLLKADKDSEAGVPPSKELIERMGGFIEEITNDGGGSRVEQTVPRGAGRR